MTTDTSTTTEESVESESSAAESSSTVTSDEGEIAMDGVAAASLDELEGTPVSVFDGQVFVSFAGFDEENSRLLLRLDNNMDAQLCTRAHPDTYVNGEKVVLNPLGPNQKLAAVTVEPGCYHIISYKVDTRCFTADTLSITATLRLVADDTHEEQLEDYDLTIK